MPAFRCTSTARPTSIASQTASSLKRLDLSSGELFGLVALRSLGASIGGTIGASIDDVAEKLVDSAGRGVRARVDAGSPVAFRLSEIRLDERGERAFALLSAAERSSRSARFAYLDKEGKGSTRTHSTPTASSINAGRVYCVAYDHTRRDMRTFAIDSVTDPEVLGATFVRPSGFSIEAYAAASISGVLHADETTVVRVRFAPRVAKAAVAARVVAEREVEHRGDGSAEIAYTVADVDELVRWVLGWGAQAEIVSPRAARGRISKLAKEIAVKYEM